MKVSCLTLPFEACNFTKGANTLLLQDEDFQEVVGDFASAAQYAKLAGFDGSPVRAVLRSLP